MNWSDLINGCFELIGGVTVMLNVCALLRHKQVRGVHWASTVFFTSWGCFNLFFYPHNRLWFSFAGGLLIMLANAAWLFLALRYSRAAL